MTLPFLFAVFLIFCVEFGKFELLVMSEFFESFLSFHGFGSGFERFNIDKALRLMDLRVPSAFPVKVKSET